MVCERVVCDNNVVCERVVCDNVVCERVVCVCDNVVCERVVQVQGKALQFRSQRLEGGREKQWPKRVTLLNLGCGVKSVARAGCTTVPKEDHGSLQPEVLDVQVRRVRRHLHSKSGTWQGPTGRPFHWIMS